MKHTEIEANLWGIVVGEDDESAHEFQVHFYPTMEKTYSGSTPSGGPDPDGYNLKIEIVSVSVDNADIKFIFYANKPQHLNSLFVAKALEKKFKNYIEASFTGEYEEIFQE